jgi:uncharacterized UBP type Zn finger protein
MKRNKNLMKESIEKNKKLKEERPNHKYQNAKNTNQQFFEEDRKKKKKKKSSPATN